MPMYTYTCSECGVTRDEVRAIARRDEPAVCTCGGEAARDTQREDAVLRTDSYHYTSVITARGERVRTGKRSGLFATGLAPSKQDQTKNFHKARR